MGESTLTIKFKGIEGDILDDMVTSGLFATKSEAIRSALVKYAIDADLFKRKKLWDRIKRVPLKRVPLNRLREDIEVARHEARSIPRH